MTDEEFRGYFMGEGYLGCHTYHRKDKTFLRAVAKISLRRDDIEVLKVIQKRFGGHLFNDNHLRSIVGNNKIYKRSPMTMWICVSKIELLEIGKVLSKTQLPAKKMKELSLWLKFINLIPKRGGRYKRGQREIMLRIIDELKQMRKYKEL